MAGIRSYSLNFRLDRRISTTPILVLLRRSHIRNIILVIATATVYAMNFVIAQDGYNLTYELGRSMRMYSVEYSHDHHLHLSGVLFDVNSSQQEVYVAVLDTLGEIVVFTSVSHPDSNHLASNPESGMLVTSDLKSVVPFVYFGGPSFGLVILDSLGNIEFIREYPRDSGSVSSPHDVVALSDGYLITGWTSKPPLFRTDAFVLKTDKHGDYKWL